MLKLLITGASGLWGQFLFNYFNNKYIVYGTFNKSLYLKHKNLVYIDLTDRKSIVEVLDSINPDILIHTAAVSKVRLCEENKSFTDKVNIESVKYISEWCNKKNKKIIFFSTDMVYNSENEEILFEEDDELNPTNYYAETKIKAEEEIRVSNNNYIILRVALSYGFGDDNHKGFLNWLYDNMSENKKINLFINQWRTPIYVGDGAKFIEKLIENDVSNTTLNFGGKDKVNRVMFGELFAKIFKFNKNLINKVKVNPDDYYSKISINSSMDITKIKNITTVSPGLISENLKVIREKFHYFYMKEY